MPEVDLSRIIAGDVVLLDDGETAVIIWADDFLCLTQSWNYITDELVVLRFSVRTGAAYPDDQDIHIQKVISRTVILE